MNTKLFLSCLLISFALTTCKNGDNGEKGEPGPAGTPFSLHQNGFIRGNITGTRSGNIPFDINFDHAFYWDDDYYQFVNSVPAYHFWQYRYPTGDLSVHGYSELYYDLLPLNSTVPFNITFKAGIYSNIGSNQIFVLNIDAYQGSSAFTITNYSYDLNTHIAKGDFVINVDQFDNSTGHPALITGSFQTAPLSIYMQRKG